jgi:hypothetical protein
MIGSQECDFSTNRTPSSAIRAEIAPSFNQSHLCADFSQPIIFNHRIETANQFLKKCDMANEQKQKNYICHDYT